MKAAFDDSAYEYDISFTNTTIGRLQRGQVWNYIEQHFDDLKGKKVLELNCGTGEDALFFAHHGCTVLATDVSKKMLAITGNKSATNGFSHLIKTQYYNLEQPDIITGSNTYDIIFSNFGGLNCIAPGKLQELLVHCTQLLKPDGRIILIMMPRFCIWETIYYALKLDFKKAFRRNTTKPVIGKTDNTQLPVWYYNKKNLLAFDSGLQYVQAKPIGIAIPPSYFKQTIINKKPLLQTLAAIEQMLNRFSFLSNYSDHYLLDLKLK